ncbi:hypothetical protein [Fundicoccus ignavus]|uniref:Uncharacterized protein n=1 Tax=Fundicoccus ignavus TaxID=2664442 RepID=A0A844C337_9LACT|nr:hypothetical protein [Fundicoccus ignavus]MRJ48514.1 hypothetical protein [Fundicoccus ignavus]
MSTSTAVVKIDKERHSEIKMYAFFKGLTIVEIINNAVGLYLNGSDDFLEFKKKYILPEKERNITVKLEEYDKLVEIAKQHNLNLKL